MPRRPDMPPLQRSALADDPIEQFRDWYERAEREVPLAHAMTLATVDADGAPDARMVLLKGFGPEAFRFFTNLASAKARQLEATPRAALVLYWRELDRQVRVRGPVERLPEAASDEYFASRPRDSQIGAWASPQSEPLPDRAALDARVDEVEQRFSARRGSPPGLLGRLRPSPRADRVLAGPGRPPPRPLPLHARGRRLADRAAGALAGRQRPLLREGEQLVQVVEVELGADAAAGGTDADAGAERRLERLLGAGPGRPPDRGGGRPWSRFGASASFALRSVSRTDQSRAAASRASARRASLSGAWRIARP